MYSKSERIPGILTVQCFVRFSETIIIYRIAGIFRGYKCSWFSLADQAPTANIYTHKFNIACMLERLLFRRENLSNGHSAKVYTLGNIPAIYTVVNSHASLCLPLLMVTTVLIPAPH